MGDGLVFTNGFLSPLVVSVEPCKLVLLSSPVHGSPQFWGDDSADRGQIHIHLHQEGGHVARVSLMVPDSRDPGPYGSFMLWRHTLPSMPDPLLSHVQSKHWFLAYLRLALLVDC